jgi:hypothetical protein
MLGIVATHAIYLGGSPNDMGFIYYRQLLNFAVPVLFYLGLLVFKKANLDIGLI